MLATAITLAIAIKSSPPRLGWINPSRRQHRTPAPSPTAGYGAQVRIATTRTRRNWPCFLGNLVITYGSGPPRSVLTRVVASGASSRTGRSASSSCLPNRYGYAIPAIRRADQRCQPEHPEPRGCAVTVEERDPRRARRVDRGVGDRDGDQVDQGEGKADGQTGQSLGRPDLRFHDLRQIRCGAGGPDGCHAGR